MKKSERLKKLETELQDLEQWLQLGLVPKKEQHKHKDEMEQLRSKIEEEKERIRFLKESGDLEEYVTPKRAQGREAYQGDMPTMHDGEYAESNQNDSSETTYGGEDETRYGDEEETMVEEESYFNEKARWKRSRMIIDPDADQN